MFLLANRSDVALCRHALDDGCAPGGQAISPAAARTGNDSPASVGVAATPVVPRTRLLAVAGAADCAETSGTPVAAGVVALDASPDGDVTAAVKSGTDAEPSPSDARVASDILAGETTLFDSMPASLVVDLTVPVWEYWGSRSLRGLTLARGPTDMGTMSNTVRRHTDSAIDMKTLIFRWLYIANPHSSVTLVPSVSCHSRETDDSPESFRP